MVNFITCVLFDNPTDCTTAANEIAASSLVNDIDITGHAIYTAGRILIFGHDEEDELYKLAKYYYAQGNGNGGVYQNTANWSIQCIDQFGLYAVDAGLHTVVQ